MMIFLCLLFLQPDTSYIEFLKTECKRSTRIVAKSAFIKSYPDQNVNMDHLECLLGKCADECRLTPEEIRDLGSSIGNKLLSEIQTDRFSLGPFIIRGFCPEIVGKKANELVDVINKDSQDFMEQALENLNSMRGDVALIDARFEKVYYSVLLEPFCLSKLKFVNFVLVIVPR